MTNEQKVLLVGLRSVADRLDKLKFQVSNIGDCIEKIDLIEEDEASDLLKELEEGITGVDKLYNDIKDLYPFVIKQFK